MTNGQSTAVQTARPKINVDGKDNAALGDGLLEMLIVENTNGLYRCEASFGNLGLKNQRASQFLYFDRQTLDFGKTFKVKIGSDVIFDGKITGLEGFFPDGGAPSITVLAEDRLQDLRATRRTRTFTQISDSDLFNQIAGDYQLAGNVNVSGPTHDVLAQVNQSDLAFLRERARAIDAELWVDGSTLNASSRAERNGGTLQMDYHHTLHEFTVLADLSGQRSSVTVSGWDVKNKDGLKYEATVSAVQSELNGDTSGPSILDSAGFGARKEVLAHTVPLTSDHAQAQAEAYFKMSARRFVTGHGVADANSQLRVGNFVDLGGLGLFNGKYYLSEVRHIFGAMGIRTEFTAERPGLSRQ